MGLTIKKTFTILFFISLSQLLYSQKLTGTWEGELLQGNKPYLFKLNLQQTRNLIRGYSFIYDQSGYWGKMSFSGVIKNDTIYYKESSIKSQKPGPNIWCIKSAQLKYGKKNGEEIISGKWFGECTPGTIKISKKSEIDSLDMEDPGDLVMDDGKVVSIAKRNLKPGKSLKTNRLILTAYIFDNREQDGDSITLIFNDNVILKNYVIGKEPKKIKLKIDTSLKQNTLILFAENLGKTPPNTASLMIRTGYGKKVIALHSDFNSSDNVTFVFTPPRNTNDGNIPVSPGFK